MNVRALTVSEPIETADDPLVIGLVTIDARTGAVGADLGFRRFCTGADGTLPLETFCDLLALVVPDERLAFASRMIGETTAQRGRSVTCRIAGALGEPVTVRFLRSCRAAAGTAGEPATYIAVLVPETAAEAAPLDRIARLLIEAEGLAGGLDNPMLAKLIRAVLLQVGFDAVAALKAAGAAGGGPVRH